jgi:hypothetical protein
MTETMLIRNHSSAKISLAILLVILTFAKAVDQPMGSSRVVKAADQHSVKFLVPDPPHVRQLFNQALLHFFDTKDVSSAWKKVIAPTDRVGIKIHTDSGPMMCHRALVNAVTESLIEAGVHRDKIIIFDRYTHQMENAGFSYQEDKNEILMTATVPTEGYDSKEFVDLPVPGKLIWGDHEFKRNIPKTDEQLGTKSYFSKILTQRIDKMINIGIPMSDPKLGLYGCQLSSSLSLVDNFRRLERPGVTRDDSLTEIFSNQVLQKKCVLQILDALVIQFAGGPGFEPQYCFPLQTLYLSKDAVALDSLVMEEINRLRSKRAVSNTQETATYNQAASEANLGVSDPKKMDLIEIHLDH